MKIWWFFKSDFFFGGGGLGMLEKKLGSVELKAGYGPISTTKEKDKLPALSKCNLSWKIFVLPIVSLYRVLFLWYATMIFDFVDECYYIAAHKCVSQFEPFGGRCEYVFWKMIFRFFLELGLISDKDL